MEYLIATLTIFLCLMGVILSSLGFAGTWFVPLAALVTKLTLGFPDIGTLIVFLALCVLAELIEALAGYYGVTAKGGSKLAGLAAMVGGLIGAAIGSAVFPIIGTFFGMLAGSFVLSFLIEWSRLKKSDSAARIAMGALLARLGVLFLKTALTLAMSLWLIGAL